MRKLFFIVILFAVIAQGQTKPTRAPVSLTPEASRQWIDLNLRIENMRLQQQLIQAKAQVPEDYRLMGTDDQGRLLFAPPVEAAAKASPEKK